MKSFWVIYLREVRVRLKDWRFWVGLLTVPLFIGLSLAIPTAIQREPDPLRVYVVGDSSLAAYSVPQLTFIPIPPSAYDSLQTHLSKGEVLLNLEKEPYTALTQGTLSVSQEEGLRQLLYQATLSRQAQAMGLSSTDIQRLQHVPDINFYDLTQKKENSGGKVYLLSSLLSSVLFLLILLTGNVVLMSTLEEKANRLVEYLLIYTSPESLLAGKVLSAISLAFVQVGLWSSIAAIGLSQLPASIKQGLLRFLDVPWGEAGLFIVMGLVLYAFLYAAAGATSDSPTELSNLAQTIQWPFMAGFFLVIALSVNPHHGLMRFLSYFPLTAPLAMPIRLIAGGISWWEKLLSSGLLIGGIILGWYAAAKVYRAALLLYGQKLGWKALWHILRR